MGAPAAVNVPTAQLGQTVELAVDITAPAEGGVHRGYWRLRNPQGTFFGDELWVQMNIPSDNSSGNPPPAGGGPAISLSCTNCPVTVPPGQQFRPTIHATVNSGDLQGVDLRGDMLRHKSGDRFGAYELVAVPGRTVIPTNGSYDFTFYEEHPVTAPTTPGVYESVWQIWRNGGWDGEEYVLRFEVKEGGGSSNHPPNAPTLTDPGDWAVYTGNGGIVLTAQQSGDPDGDAVNQYYFDIFDSAQNANSGWVTSNSWSPQGLGYNGYKWRVKVRDAGGAESAWSPQTWHFTVQTNEPQIYDFGYQWCHQPWGDSEQICFCARTNAGTIRLQVNRATDGSDHGEWQILNELGSSDWRCESDSDHPPTWTQLEYAAGRHLVRLYARRDGGWEAAASRDIYVDLPAERRPNSILPLQPKDGSFLNTREVLLDWSDTLRTSEYRLEIALDQNSSDRLLDVTLPAGTSQYVYNFDADYPLVYWRVTSSGPYGSNQGGWSRFQIDRTPPSSNIVALPEAVPEIQFTVQWGGSDSLSGLNWYHVQVRDGNRSNSLWEDWLVNTTKTAEIFSGSPGHIYYFRVRAMDKIGNWEAWPSGDGDTFTRVDPASAPETNWWDSDYSQKTNLIILNNDGDTIPVGFPVHIHLDDTTTPTAAQIYDLSVAANKGDDVRVVYDDETELDRIVQTFSSTAIDIWFPSQVGISGGQADSTTHQLYLGNADPGTPPANVNAVNLPPSDSNTVGLWHFAEGSGTTVYDSSGRGRNGSFENSGWGSGYLGIAGVFNGVNSTVNLGNYSEVDNLGPFTIEAWVRPDDIGWGMIFMKADQFRLNLTDRNSVQFVIQGDGGDRYVESNITLQVGRWYHVAGVHDGGNNQWLYINGVQAGFNGDSRTPNKRSNPFYLGNAPWWSGNVLHGAMQHARVSNIARHDFPYGRVDVSPSVALGTLTTPPVVGDVDLAILSVNAYPASSGGLIVAAVVKNQGNANTRNGFYTDLYVDHLPTGAGDQTGSVRFWVNSAIEPGAVVTLTTKLADLAVSAAGSLEASTVVPDEFVLTAENDTEAPSNDEVSLAAAEATVSEQRATLYSQVDTAGLVREPDKANNITPVGVEVCTAAGDALESDNGRTQAKQLQMGQGYNHNFHRMEDQDWGKFTAVSGVTYDIHTSDLGVDADTYLDLFGPDGATLLASNDDTVDSLASAITWKAPAGGTYYVRIKHWNPQAAGCGTTYRLIIAEVDTTPPAKPSLVAPNDSQQLTDRKPTLRWNAVADATTYQVQIFDSAVAAAAEDLSGRLVDATTTATSYPVAITLSDGDYFWRVRAKDAADNWSAWSAVRTFTIAVSSVPTSRSLLLPWLTIKAAASATNTAQEEPKQRLLLPEIPGAR